MYEHCFGVPVHPDLQQTSPRLHDPDDEKQQPPMGAGAGDGGPGPGPGCGEGEGPAEHESLLVNTALRALHIGCDWKQSEPPPRLRCDGIRFTPPTQTNGFVEVVDTAIFEWSLVYLKVWAGSKERPSTFMILNAELLFVVQYVADHGDRRHVST